MYMDIFFPKGLKTNLKTNRQPCVETSVERARSAGLAERHRLFNSRHRDFDKSISVSKSQRRDF